MNPLLATFVIEARELLQEAGQDLLSLERTPGDADAINRLFRSVHTLKGSSGLFEAGPLTRLLHALEDMFMAVREHGLALTPQMVDLALQALDRTSQWIDQLDRDEALGEEADTVAKTLVAELRSRFGRREGEVLGAPAASGAASQAVPDKTIADVTRWFSEAARRSAAAGGQPVHLVSYLPEDGCFFKGEDPLHLALQIPDMQALVIAPRIPWAPVAILDPFSCNLAFHALSTAARPALDTLLRYVPDQVTISEIPAAVLGAGAAAPADAGTEGSAGGGAAHAVQALLREQMELLALAAPAEECAGRIEAAAAVAINVLRFGQHDGAEAIEAAKAVALAAGSGDALRAAIGAALAQFATIAAAAAPRPGVAAAAAKPEAAAGGSVVPRTLRVDQEKIDALMNLVAELVVAKNSLPFLARRAELQFGLRELGREIKDQYGVIDRIAQELQSAVMAVRMMPVGQVFQRFPRLVRDLSRKLGKQVDLVIEGEETEADKNVIENLFDPLLHMVRNSLDHGIEPPEERARHGKPAAASVKLRAQHDGDQVVIEIVDDGRGIDPELVKRRAYERGLLSEERLTTIDDDEARMLIFGAGFSTAEQVSDLSGRGVGMDVVRNAVEKAGGRIALSSIKGHGTTVRLHLPLSMAVSRVMTVMLDGRLFGIPMDLIRETVRIPAANIHRIKSHETFVLRDRVVPLLRLRQLLDLPDMAQAGTVPDPHDEVAVLVVRVAGQTIGLAVSAFGEGMEVILKPMEGMLSRLGGCVGTALLGDGRVLLVLDLKELMP